MTSPRSRSTEMTRGWEMLARFGARFSVRAGELEAIAMVPPPKRKFHGSVARTVTAKVFPSRLKGLKPQPAEHSREVADKRKRGRAPAPASLDVFHRH